MAGNRPDGPIPGLGDARPPADVQAILLRIKPPGRGAVRMQAFITDNLAVEQSEPDPPVPVLVHIVNPEFAVCPLYLLPCDRNLEGFGLALSLHGQCYRSACRSIEPASPSTGGLLVHSEAAVSQLQARSLSGAPGGQGVDHPPATHAPMPSPQDTAGAAPSGTGETRRPGISARTDTATSPDV